MMQYMEHMQRMQTLLCRKELEGFLSPGDEQELADLRLLLSAAAAADTEEVPEPTLAQVMAELAALRTQTDRVDRVQQELLERIQAPALRSNLLHFFRGFGAAILTLPLLGVVGVGCLWLADWLAGSMALPVPLTLGILLCLVLGGLLLVCSGPMTRLLFRWITCQDDE